MENDRGRWPARRREPEPQIVVGARARFRLLRFGALAGKRALAEETALAGIDILAAVGLAQEERVGAAVRDEAGMRFESTDERDSGLQPVGALGVGPHDEQLGVAPGADPAL